MRSHSDFDGSTLYISARSPFARRVRLAFLEHGVSYTEKVFDVLKHNPELLEVNPLGRVPSIVLKDGGTIIDSNLILQGFYESIPTGTPSLMPSAAAERRECYRWMGTLSGFCEKCVEFFLEMQRPAERQDPGTLDECRSVTQAVLHRLESRLRDRDHLVGTALTQADLDAGTALAYYTLRISKDWSATYPGCARFLERLNARPSFIRTTPPPAS